MTCNSFISSTHLQPQNISITSSPILRSLSLSNGVDPQFVNNSNQIIFGWNANPFGRNNDGTIEYAHAIKTRHNSLESLGNNIDFFTSSKSKEVSENDGELVCRNVQKTA